MGQTTRMWKTLSKAERNDLARIFLRLSDAYSPRKGRA
jgi:hypothetical protein